MIRRPPRSTRTDTPFPYTTLFRSTSAAILRIFLKMARATNVVTHVPDRDNGYGFGDENCENAISEYPDLIVLLDCGTQNHSSIAKTGEMAIDRKSTRLNSSH